LGTTTLRSAKGENSEPMKQSIARIYNMGGRDIWRARNSKNFVLHTMRG